MGKDKLRRFAEINAFANVLQLEEAKPLKDNWAQTYFKNNNPIVLELACGKGEYAVKLAELFPDKNFIGIDLKGNRIWRGAKTAVEEKIDNVAFLRIQIETFAGLLQPQRNRRNLDYVPRSATTNQQRKEKINFAKILR